MTLSAPRSAAAASGAALPTLAGAPEGQDARLIADLAAQDGGQPVIHVALDDNRSAVMAEALRFFAPELPQYSLPAWDCLPYDRTGPNADITAARVTALTELATAPPKGAAVLLTTVNALVQKVPPAEVFRAAGFTAKVGQRLDLGQLQAYLAHNGYNRAQTVREPGEYALRGDIVDIFPPGAAEPLRLDLFGDDVEQIRAFDPVTQRTTVKRKAVKLVPMAELFLDDDSIKRFRAGYRELFGSSLDDPLYEAVSEGRRHPGMEHWLPLFYDRLVPIWDYLPRAMLVMDASGEDARLARQGQVQDFFEARETHRALEKKAGSTPYKPLPPGRLYLMEDEFAEALQGHGRLQLFPFMAADADRNARDGGGRRGRDFGDVRAQPDTNLYRAVRDHARKLQTEGRRVAIAAYTAGSRMRLDGLLKEHGEAAVEPVETLAEWQALDPRVLASIVLPLERGFVAADLAVITEQDILGDRLARPARRKRKNPNAIAEASSLQPGDAVVHASHGIGRFDGLEAIAVQGAPHDCLRLVYADGDKLYLPVENIELLTRYGSADAEPVLDKLGTGGWQGRKAKVKQRLKDMADKLLAIAAQRLLQKADPIAPPEGLWDEFCARFPYPETDDQLKAIDDVVGDLGSGQSMDRLICGDVGFGKTEVALRAAFVSAMNGNQVAVVVPTTLLARQHARNFLDRFKGLPLNIAQLSRLVTAKEVKAVKDGLADGTVDIVIGTHALLGKGVEFKRLGLMIVDEEQHFGVKQKERLKELKANVHVLTLSATPIPRTMQMALVGLRDLSIIATPPVDRLAVRTFVLPWDPVVVREAIMREHFRGGQSFVVCPRLEDLPKVEERLKELVPEIKIAVAHGRMAASELDEVMEAFDEGRFDLLLATNIVESGIDVPRANTMIVHRADMFGLAQLYQLRGRIGRAKLRGYAYLTTNPRKPLSTVAQQRLHVIETLDTLGAGFQLASHDMDIRGAGNLLGEEQSGHVKEVGVELYQQMLKDVVDAARRRAAAKGRPVPEGEEEDGADAWSPTLNLGLPVMIPEDYVPDLAVRMELYGRLGEIAADSDIDAFAAEMIDRFGQLPAEVENLMKLMAMKAACRKAGVERIEAGPKGAVVTFRNNGFKDPKALIALISKAAGSLKLRPDHKLVYARNWETPAQRVKGASSLLKHLVEAAGGA